MLSMSRSTDDYHLEVGEPRSAGRRTGKSQTSRQRGQALPAAHALIGPVRPLLSFIVRGGATAARNVFDRLELIWRAPDLGRVTIHAAIPAISIHQQWGDGGRDSPISRRDDRPVGGETSGQTTSSLTSPVRSGRPTATLRRERSATTAGAIR